MINPYKRMTKQQKAMKNVRDGFLDLIIRGKPILRTKWFAIWFLRK
jgi:hypothetical protein